MASSNFRLIARLDVKGRHLIKSVRLEGVRKVGYPEEFAREYYHQGIDEIFYLDAVASLYNRNNLTNIVEQTAREVFVPITAGGGIRSVSDAELLLRSGADKIAVNTAATIEPKLITDLASAFGTQCVVLSVQAKRTPHGGWEALRDMGREKTNLDVLEWVQKGENLGAGEILLTSVDREGTKLGFDVELVKLVSESVSIPVIASGGMGGNDDLIDVAMEGHADAVAMARVLHYRDITIADARKAVQSIGIKVRTP